MLTQKQQYYVLNQLLHGNNCAEIIRDESIAEKDKVFVLSLVEKCHDLKVQRYDKVVKTFINYLRIPEYLQCVDTNSGNIISIDQIIETCRMMDLPVHQCEHWAIGVISKAVVVEDSDPCVSDGTFYMPKSWVDSDYDAMAAMCKAFAVCVWGVENPTAEWKQMVQRLHEILRPEDSFSFKKGELEHFVDIWVRHGVSPCVLSSTAFVVNDLQSMYTLSGGALCWWTDPSQTVVTTLLPVGKSKLAEGRLPAELFLDICTKDIGSLCTMQIKGDRIVYASGKEL